MLISSFRIRSKMREKNVRHLWSLFLSGVIGLLISMYSQFLSNFLNNSSFRLISSLYSLTIFLWAFLLYRGIGKEL